MMISVDEMDKNDPLYHAITKMFDEVFSKEEGNASTSADALKYDHGKLRLDLIPTTAYNSLGSVLTYGAKKYADNTWQGVERERYIAALLRHMVAYLDDPQGKDGESGLLHSEHMLTNAMFLNHFACKENETGGE